MILFGTRSSLVVEYEETCWRSGIEIEAAVSFHPAPRLLDISKSVMSADFDPTEAKTGFIPCAFVPDTRMDYFERAAGMGLRPADPLVDPTSVIAASARLSGATYVNAAAVVGAVSLIGEAVLINRSASVGHHCILEDFVSIGPGATLASNIRVGRGTIIGAGATVLPNVRIGSGAVVAGGTTVRTNVDDGMLVATGGRMTVKRFNRKLSSLFSEDEE